MNGSRATKRWRQTGSGWPSNHEFSSNPSGSICYMSQYSPFCRKTAWVGFFITHKQESLIVIVYPMRLLPKILHEENYNVIHPDVSVQEINAIIRLISKKYNASSGALLGTELEPNPQIFLDTSSPVEVDKTGWVLCGASLFLLRV